MSSGNSRESSADDEHAEQLKVYKHLATFAEPSRELDVEKEVVRLVRILRALRSPTGCPWDRVQTHESLAPHAVEEVYELVEAIENGDTGELRDELGDVLLQVVFHAQLADESGSFDFADVARQISEKLIRRHPHVFAEASADEVSDVESIWADAKRKEGRVKSVFSVGEGLPPLVRAFKLTKEAAKFGFDWDSVDDVLPVLADEVEELRVELDAKNLEAAAEELGDVMFSAVNLARKLGRDPESLLRAANRKFERRFRGLLALATSRGLDVKLMPLNELDELWSAVKNDERGPSSA